MSKWVHGVNNRATTINLSRPLQSTYFWSLGRDEKQLRKILNEPDESDQSDKSNCPRRNDSTCPVGNYCSNRECPKCKCFNCSCSEDGDLPNPHGDSCSCPNCREYADYTEFIATLIDPEGQGVSSGIWIGHESRIIKQPDPDATDSIEYITGLRSGDAV